MFIRRSPDILPSEITDQDLYLNRRKFLAVAGVTLGAALVGGKTAPAFSALPPSMAVGGKTAPAFSALPPSMAGALPWPSVREKILSTGASWHDTYCAHD